MAVKFQHKAAAAVRMSVSHQIVAIVHVVGKYFSGAKLYLCSGRNVCVKKRKWRKEKEMGAAE